MLARARPSTPDAVVRDLSSTDHRARIDAAQHAAAVVAESGDGVRGRIVEALAEALSDPDPRVRAPVALALADLRAHEALPALLVAADDDVDLVRQFALLALGEIGDPRARERIRRALRDPRPEVRYQAIVAFPRIACAGRDARDVDPEVWGALAAGLDDDDEQVCGRAAEACAELADGAPLPPTVADRLARVARDGELPENARVAAAIALAESKDDRGADVLLAVMRGDVDEPDARRVHAVFELAGELKLEAARPLASNAAFGLRARLGDPSRRSAALVALVRLGDPKAIEHVLGELAGRSYERRAMAVGIASRAAMAEARPRLVELLRDPTLADAHAVAEAIARIDAEHRAEPGADPEVGAGT